MCNPTLTRERALRLARQRAAKGMPISAHVATHLIDTLAEALEQLRELKYQPKQAGAPRENEG